MMSKELEDILRAIVGQEVTDFYPEGLDEYGCPVSFGNADDVYSDGFDVGCKQGEFDLAVRLLGAVI